MRHGQKMRVGLMVIAAGMFASMAGAAGEAPAAADVAQPQVGARAMAGQAWSLDLGGGVKMEFVWIEALKGWVGKYEVTNGEYRRFKPTHRSGEYHGPPVTSIEGERLPVSMVCYDDAVAFAAWATQTAGTQLPAGHAIRLPDEGEWTTFAQCGEDRKYPWGNEWPPRYGNYRDATGAKAFAHWGVGIEGYDDGFAVACPVEKSGRNEWGLYGVGGNVWELTSEYGESVMRGGSWHRNDQGNTSLNCRRPYPRSARDTGVGFRVVMMPAVARPAAAQQASDTQNLNMPSVKPVAVIPFMAKAPAIDGVISDGEWNTLHVSRFVGQDRDLLQRRPGEFWVGCDKKRIYVAVRSGVHPTAGAVTKIKEAVGTKDESDTVFDDSIELFFNNAPDGGPGEYYQVLVNSAGVLFDQEFDTNEKIGRTYWRVDMEQSHKVENGIWTAEFSIDLSSVKVKDPTRPLAMRVCRNFKHSWDQSRWAPRVIAFDAPDTMPRVRFSDAAPVVNEIEFQDDKGICVAVELSNPGAQPLPVAVKLGYNAESQPRYYQDTQVELKPGETRRFEYRKDFFTGGSYPALAEILVTGAGGVVLHHRDVKWRTRAPGTGWEPMGNAAPEEAVRFGFEFHPTPRAARWKVEFAGMKGREDVKAARLEIAPTNAGAKAVFTAPAAPDASFAVPARMETIKNLKDGTYEARLYLDGATPAGKPVKTAIFGLRTDFPWLNNTIGKDDIVIPPFTAMEVSGKTIKTVLREHTLADNGLWEQVTAEGRPLLAGPMRLEVVRDGKMEVAKGQAKFGAKKPTAVAAEADWQAAGVRGRTQMTMEYDGCAKVTLSLAPTDDEPIDSLRLVVPLADREASLMHAVGDGIRFNYAGAVPKGKGRVWGSDKASRSQLLGTFLPYLWVGGESRGLCWFAGNDRDWVLDPQEKVPALELRRTGSALELVVNLVQVPAALKRERTIVFGLQATPAKPMPENWRHMGVASGVPEDYQILGMSMYWGASLYNVAPRGGDYEVVRKIAARGRGEGRDEAFFKAYKARNPDIQAEIDWSANGGKVAGIMPYTNLRGDNDRNPEWFIYQDEWRNAAFSERTPPGGHYGPVDFCVALPPSRVDFLLYHYKKLIENGFAAIYWDNIFIVGNANPVTGAAYWRESGGMQPEGDIWQVREVTRRTAVMLHLMGKKNASVPHMTNAQLVPAFCWTGINLDWEWKYGNTDYQDRFTRDYIRACSLGLSHGGVPMIINGTKDTRSTQEAEWVDRTQVAACVPHEIKVWQTTPVYGKLMKAMLDLGYGDPKCVVHRYWEENPVARIDGIDGIFLVLNGKDKALLLVSDYGNGGTARITLDTERLGLPPDFAAVNWEKPDETVRASGGVLKLEGIRKHDFRAVLIGKR